MVPTSPVATTTGPPQLLIIRISEADDDAYFHRVELLGGDGPEPIELAAGTLDAELPPFGDGPQGDPGRLVRDVVLGDYPPGSGPTGTAGAYLYDLLIKSGVGAAWHDARAGAPGTLTVLDIRAPNYARLPWELLTDNGKQVRTLVRGRLPFGAEPGTEATPMRVLVVVGSDDPELKAETEVAAIQRALADRPWQAHTEVLVQPSSHDFYERVDQLRPHVLHFIGHGEMSPGVDVPVLDFVDALSGESWSLSASHIRNGLLSWVPRVLVLNACHTGTMSAQDGVWGIAEAGIDAGMSAVVCMQGPIETGIAVQFSNEFYRCLNTGLRVDEAVATARFAITRQVGPERRDWGMPVLHLGAPPAAVLSMACPLTDAERHRLLQIPEFAEARRHVDRDEQRRHMWWTDGRPGGTPTGLVTVTGAAGTGRTQLVYSALLTCAGQGHEVRYVDLAGARRKSWIQVLYAIRDGTPRPNISSALREPLPATAFADFNREIERLAGGKNPRPGDPVPKKAPVPDFTAATEYAPTYEARIAVRFIEALGRAAADRPLTIAIDHVGGASQGGAVPEQVTSHLSPLLLRAAARAELGPVRLILVLGDDEHDLLTADVRTAMHEVRVAGFQSRLFRFLQRERFARCGYRDDEWQRYESLVDYFAHGDVGDGWLPSWFGFFEAARQVSGR